MSLKFFLFFWSTPHIQRLDAVNTKSKVWHEKIYLSATYLLGGFMKKTFVFGQKKYLLFYHLICRVNLELYCWGKASNTLGGDHRPLVKILWSRFKETPLHRQVHQVFCTWCVKIWKTLLLLQLKELWNSYLWSGLRKESEPKYHPLVKFGREARSPVIRYTGHLAPWEMSSLTTVYSFSYWYHFNSEHAHLLRCLARSSGKTSGQVGLDEAWRATGARDLWEPGNFSDSKASWWMNCGSSKRCNCYMIDSCVARYLRPRSIV